MWVWRMCHGANWRVPKHFQHTCWVLMKDLAQLRKGLFSRFFRNGISPSPSISSIYLFPAFSSTCASGILANQNGPVKTKFLCANTLNNIGPTKHFSSLLTIWRLMASSKLTVPIVLAFLMRCSTHRRSSISGQIFGTAESEPLCLSVKQVVLGLLRKLRRWGNFVVFARRLVYLAASSFACTTVAT